MIAAHLHAVLAGESSVSGTNDIDSEPRSCGGFTKIRDVKGNTVRRPVIN
jgi:hypothetical protein